MTLKGLPSQKQEPAFRLLNAEESDIVAELFHETYEKLAPEHGYETREASAKPWSEVPENNQQLMRHVMLTLMRVGEDGRVLLLGHVE